VNHANDVASGAADHAVGDGPHSTEPSFLVDDNHKLVHGVRHGWRELHLIVRTGENDKADGAHWTWPIHWVEIRSAEAHADDINLRRHPQSIVPLHHSLAEAREPQRFQVDGSRSDRVSHIPTTVGSTSLNVNRVWLAAKTKRFIAESTEWGRLLPAPELVAAAAGRAIY
jgi:hypothetical protein